MKKLRLDIGEIRVLGFQVTPSEAAPHGTVMARDGFATALCPTTTNGEEPTCRRGSCHSGNPCSECP